MALIMVAEDDVGLLMMVKLFLEAKGHQVVTVTDGMAAAETAAQAKPQLILSDVQMPNAYGTTAWEMLQRSPVTAGLPVIFMSGISEEKAKKIVPENPKVRFLPKPINFDLLDRYIAELVPAA